MFKLSAAVLLIGILASAYILTSCNKSEQDKIQQVKPENVHDSAKPHTDTIPISSAKINQDSLEAAIVQKKRNDSLKALKKSEVKIQAYYFHPTARCVTCRTIEAYSHEAIEQWAKKNRKEVAWSELNIEDSVNLHYIDEYNLEFSSLIIVKYTGGKKDKWKNLEDTWKLVNDKDLFMEYVTGELSEFVKN